jgi:hypothetical protein
VISTREETRLLKFTDRTPRTAEKKDERARQAERATAEYHARKAVIAAQTEKLKALRLARDAEIGDDDKVKPRRAKKEPSVVA